MSLAPWMRGFVLGAAVGLLALLFMRPGPDADVAVLEATVARYERVIATQARELVQTSAKADSAQELHVRDSLALVVSRVRERPVIAAARVEANAAAAVQTQAGDSLEATLDTLAVRVPMELRPVVAAAQVQQAEQRTAGVTFRLAMQAQIDGQARLLVVTDSALASTGAAILAERARGDAAAGLAELRDVVIGEKDQLIEVWQARACGKICAAKKLALGIGIGVGLKTLADLLRP